MNRNVLLAAGAGAVALVGLIAAVEPRPAQSVPIVPDDMVAFFARAACPNGWTDVSTAWHGRYVVIAADSHSSLVGNALAPGENRATGDHIHDGVRAFQGIPCARRPGVSCAAPAASGYNRNAKDTGGAKPRFPGDTVRSGTNAPYVTLRACVKH